MPILFFSLYSGEALTVPTTNYHTKETKTVSQSRGGLPTPWRCTHGDSLPLQAATFVASLWEAPRILLQRKVDRPYTFLWTWDLFWKRPLLQTLWEAPGPTSQWTFIGTLDFQVAVQACRYAEIFFLLRIRQLRDKLRDWRCSFKAKAGSICLARGSFL